MTPTEQKYTEKLETLSQLYRCFWIMNNATDSDIKKLNTLKSELADLKAEIDKSVMPTGQEYTEKLEGIAEKTLLWCNTAQSFDWVNELRKEISALNAKMEKELDYKCKKCKDEKWVETNEGRTVSPCPVCDCGNKFKVELENDKPNFRADIAEELSRSQLIDRLCELNDAYQKLREREFQRELDTIGNNKLMTAEEWMKENYFDEENGTWMKFDDYETMEEYADYKNQFGKDKPVMTAKEFLNYKGCGSGTNYTTKMAEGLLNEYHNLF